ncbi:MAG: sugar ABC transporter ATP-binding protein [Prevotella sp.]|jgi:ribose transport system ATP-binding protein|nr:sugar ABC transporter ATP-binding protein [Prevotella sp.]
MPDIKKINQIDVPLLELKNITKRFPGVVALDHVDLTIRQNEIHLVLGENGAGKSTLIKTIIGINKPEEGEIFWMGKPVKISHIKEAYDLGIAVIYQELNNVPCLSVVENMFLGREHKRARLFVDWKEQKNRARKALECVGLQDIDLDIPMEKLGMGHRQLIEIARIVDSNAKFIIMDEPTSSLSRTEINSLLDLMVDLNKRGIAVLFITHKIDEAKKVGHVVTVLKDGKNSGSTVDVNTVSEDEIIAMMVGRKLEEKYPKRSVAIGKEVFRCENLSSPKFSNVSFNLRKGELLGIFGLIGAGRTELARAIFGADSLQDGSIFIDGKEVIIKNPRSAIDKGIVLITENRKEEGLILIHSVLENTTIVTLKDFLNGPLLNNKKRNSRVIDIGNKLRLRPTDPRMNAINFSGGNQQKIVIMKWLMSGARIFIFDEPTKGVDVGAKVEIYTIMNQLLEQGSSIIMISSEIPEIMGMSDRIMTIYEGNQTGILDNDKKITEEQILTMATRRK